MPRTKNTATVKHTEEELLIECCRCGKKKKESDYYLSKYSKIWNSHGKKVPICKICIQEFFDEVIKRHDEKTAVAACCAFLDVPFSNEIYQGVLKNNSVFGIGMYMRQMQIKQYHSQTFLNSLSNGELMKTTADIRETAESKWSKKDKQNMNFVLSVVGYDPFDDGALTNDDRKYCFNVLAAYCDVDGIKEDGHKMLGCIEIAQNQLQIRKLNEMINYELASGSGDEQKVKTLSNSKKQLLDSIAKIAKDNNLSSAYNDNSKAGKSTLSLKMKEILADGYELIRVNLFDIKTSEAIKQVADISNRSIMEQLGLDSNDYTEMIKEQREMIQKYREDYEELEEENRNLKNKLSDLEVKKKR